MASIAVFQQDRIPQNRSCQKPAQHRQSTTELNTDGPPKHGNRPTNTTDHNQTIAKADCNHMDDTQKNINMPETDHYTEPQVYHHIALGCFIALAQAKAKHGTPPPTPTGRQIDTANQQLILWSYAAANVIHAISTINDVPAEQAVVIARLAEKIVDEDLPRNLNHQTHDLRTTINQHLEKLAFDRGVGRITERETEQK